MLTLFIFLVLDSLWLGYIAPGFYRTQIGHLMADRPNLIAALLFYILYIAALVHFVVEPAVTHSNIKLAFWSGAFFGLVAYATYDLTNLATLRDWPVLLTVVDLVWGTILTGTTSMLCVMGYGILAKKRTPEIS